MNKKTISVILTAVTVLALLQSIVLAAGSEYQLVLKKGRNFVSIPLVVTATPESNTIENLFANGLSQIDSLEYFDTASGQWLIYDPALPGTQELQRLDNSRAFSLYCKEDVTITVLGVSTDFLAPALAAGWNAIGVAQPVTVSAFAAGTDGFNLNYDHIYRLDEKGGVVALQSTETLEPGKGYWLDNDPDGDGVQSSVELASYGSSPALFDLVRSSSGEFVKKADAENDRRAKLNNEKIGFLADQCGQVYNPSSPQSLDELYEECRAKKAYLAEQCSQTYSPSLPQSLDELYAACKKWLSDEAAYTLAGPSVSLGGFTITHVRYKVDNSGKKVEGIGLLHPWDTPKSLQPLFSFPEEEKVLLDLKDEQVLQAVSETPHGFVIGGSGGLSFAGSKIDFLTIDADGKLEVGLTATIAPLPERNYFVRWSPPRQQGEKSNTNFIQLGLLLGNEEAPGAELTAARLWYVDAVAGQVRPYTSAAGEEWHLNLPASAAGLFEAFVTIGSENIQIANTGSPFKYRDPLEETMHLQLHGFDSAPSFEEFNARKFTWLPATASADENGVVTFTGKADTLRLLAGMNGQIADREKQTLVVDEKGRISTSDADPAWGFEKGAAFVAVRDEDFKLSIKGWKAEKGIKGITWRPAVTLYAGYTSDAVLQEVSLAATVAPDDAIKLLKQIKESGIKSVKAKLLEGKIEVDGKLLLNFDGYETAVTAKYAVKQEKFSPAATDKKIRRSTDELLNFAAVQSSDLDISLAARVRQQYIVSDASSSTTSKEGLQEEIRLSGEGRYRLPAEIAVVGGKEIAAQYRATLKLAGVDAQGKHDYQAKTSLATSMTESSDLPQSHEDGWNFGIEELRIDLEEVAVTGVNDSTEAIMRYLTPSKPKGVKKVSGYVTITPPETFVVAGPFAAALTAEKMAQQDPTAPATWRGSFSADLNFTMPLDGENNYLLLKQLIGMKQGANKWGVVVIAELHLGERSFPGTLIYDAGAYTFIAQGCNLDDTFKSIDLILTLQKGGDGKWLWTASLGGTISGKAIAELFGQDGSLASDDLMINGTLSKTTLTVQVDNVPLNWGGLPDWIILDKVRNITYSRELKSGAAADWSFAFAVDVIFTHFTDGKPPEEWPRFTMGGSYSPIGLVLSGENLGPIAMGDGAQLTIVEASAGFGSETANNKSKKFTGTVRVTLPDAWQNYTAAYGVEIPPTASASFVYGDGGFLARVILTPKTINMGGGASIKVKEMIFKKASPWASGLGSTLTLAGKECEGVVEIGQNPRFVPADSTTGMMIDLTGGYKVAISNLAIDLAAGFALSGDAVITMPEGHLLSGIVGNSFAAQISGSPESFSFSTATNLTSSLEMGLLGKASFTITSLALSSDGAFAGSGRMTLAGQTTAFVIGTAAGGGVYFTADFGAAGIDLQLAQIFMLKIRNKIGLESLGPYQYVRIDDMKTALGDSVAGADLATSKFLYFLPSALPPAGFAFFDNLDGKVSIAGFSVGLGLSFPAPSLKDIGPVMTVLGQAITGGNVDLTQLETLSAPALTLRDVALNFPKVAGVAWKDGRLQQTDNLFAALFGSDKLTLVNNKALKPKDFVQVVTADSPLDIIAVVVPASIRKGSVGMNLLGFNAAVNYDLKEDKTLYEEKSVAKLADISRLISKVRYVDENDGGLPAELQGSGGTVAAGMTGNYTGLTAKHSGKSLDVSGVSTAAGANVHQWEFVNADNQLWRLIPDGGDYYRIEAKHSGKCLDVAGAGTQNGTNVLQWDCNGADNQKWKAIPQGDNYYQLQAKHSGKCLDVAGAGTQNGANVQQWACVSVNNQKWLISPGVRGNRSKTVNIAMPANQGGGTAKVTWTVEDITAELKAIKEVVTAITPPQNAKWQDHFAYVWNTYFSKGLTYSGNRATFNYSPTISAELELTEYDSTLDVTGIKFASNQLSARFGSATLYADKNFAGKSYAVSDDMSFYALDAAIGNDKLSSVQIAGRGKITLYRDAGYQSSSTEVSGSLDSLDDSAVRDDDASSIKVYYPVALDKVTGWRLILKSNKGIVATVDAGGIEVVFPGDQKVLGLLPNGRMYKAIADTRSVLNDLKPYPALQTDAAKFLNSFWETKVLPIKASYIAGADDLAANDKPVEFRKADGSIIGFQPLVYGTDKKVSGVRFNKETGVLSSKFGKVTLFSDGNYGGKNLLVEEDIPDLGETEFGNDGASAIKIEDGGKATLYSGTNYTERWYYDYTPIKAKHSGKAMDESTVSSNNGGNIHQWDYLGNNNQKWKLIPDGGEYYRIVAKHSGKCVDVAGYWTFNMGNILQWECNGADNQRWKLNAKGGNYYQLQAKHSGRCIDVAYGWTHNGANLLQYDCHDGDNQKWLLDLAKVTYSTTAFEANDGWLGDNGIGNDTVRSIKVFNPLVINSIKEWRLQQSTPSGGIVTLAYSRDTTDNQYKTVISTDLQGTGNKLFSYYDTDNGNALNIKAFAKSEAEFPLTNYRAYVQGTPYEIADITDAAQYIRVVTRTVEFADSTKVVMNADGGFSGIYQNVALSPAEGGPANTVFTLAGPDNMSLKFNSTKTGGIGSAEIVGTNPLQYAPLYRDASGIPQGIKKAIGKVDGGFFLDAALSGGMSDAVQVTLKVSGAIQTDGKFYLTGSGDLIIANYKVSKAVVELSSDKGLHIKGVMDLYTAKVDIEGYLKPDGVFSFTGVAQVMTAGTGIKGALAVSNSGVSINGDAYIGNKKITSGIFVIKDDKVSWKSKVSIGYAGFDSTLALALGQPGASYTGRAYINLDVPIYVWGPKGWKCKRRWGIKICWPSGWGDIRIGTLPLHYNQSVSGSVDANANASIQLGRATLKVNVAKPSVSASW